MFQKEPKDCIDEAVLDQLPLSQIKTVTFFKRDELTTDLICCEVEVGGQTWFFHEEANGWARLVAHLEKLPGFRSDWFDAVAHPLFAASATVAFDRK